MQKKLLVNQQQQKMETEEEEEEEGEEEVGEEDSENQTCGRRFLNAIKPAPCPWEPVSYIRIAFVLLLIAGIVCGVIWKEPIRKAIFTKNGPLRTFVDRIGWVGPVAFGGIYAICTVLMLPGSILTLASGVIFPQFYQSFLAVSFGSTIGASLAFLLGKFFLREWVEKQIQPYPIFNAIDSAITKKGLIMVLLLRLSPVIPFNILNYGLSVTGISFISYFLGSWIGMAPGTFLYIYIGWATAHAISVNTSVLESVLIYGVGGSVTLLVVIIVTVLARRAINAEMNLNKGE